MKTLIQLFEDCVKNTVTMYSCSKRKTITKAKHSGSAGKGLPVRSRIGFMGVKGDRIALFRKEETTGGC
jgi:hypothetical protein